MGMRDTSATCDWVLLHQRAVCEKLQGDITEV